MVCLFAHTLFYVHVVPQEVVRFPEARVTGHCEPVSSTTEPSLQLTEQIFLEWKKANKLISALCDDEMLN